MTEKEELFQSIIDDENLFSKVPEKDFEELIDEFIKVYEKTGRLVKKFCKYYDFSKVLQESDSDNNDINVEETMNQLESSIRIHSEQINRLYNRITNQVNANNRTNQERIERGEQPLTLVWNDGEGGISGEQRKQRFIQVLQIAKSEIDRMSNILNSLNTLINSRNQLLNILEENGLLTVNEADLLR